MAIFPIEKAPPIMRGNDLWLNADYPIGIVAAQPADSVAVSAWSNVGGSLITCAQVTGANQPLFKINVNAGKAGILFDGSNDAMILTGTGGLTAAQRFASTAIFTLIFTFRCLGIIASGQDLEAMRGSVSTDKTTVGIDLDGILYFQVQNAGVTTLVSTPFSETTKPHIVVVTNDGSNGLALYLDGVLAAGSSASANTSGTANSVAIGNIPGLTRPFNGYMFDVFHSNKILSTTERNRITNFFANLRGIAL